MCIRDRDGVPFLRDLPGVRLLFSEKSDRKFKKSVTILLTPRALEKSPPAGDETPSAPNKGEAVPDRETVPQKSGAEQKAPQNPDNVMLRQLLEENLRNNKVLRADYRKAMQSYVEIIWKDLYQKFHRRIQNGDGSFVASYRRGLEAFTNKDYAKALREWEPLVTKGVSKNGLMADIGRRYLGAADINYQIRNTEIVEVAKSLYRDLDPAD